MMENMFGRILVLFAFAVGLSMVAWPAQADSVGSYYATPSWDQTLPAATRFIVLSNFAGAAVLDRNTGLVWEKSPTANTLTWSIARISCLNKSVGGQKGWRLPSIVELTSLVDPSVLFPGPTLQPGHPFLNVAPSYWSATTNAEVPTNAWAVSFSIGGVTSGSKSELVNVWCVRGGMNADQY
jgi:Protein of unknown function (DUF1566)